MLEGEYDLDYRSVPQERGNSGIRTSRLRILADASVFPTIPSVFPTIPSVFPTIPSVFPVITVMLTAERAADLIRQDL